jgi:hypothetical protein
MRRSVRRLYEYGTWAMLVLIIVQFTAAGSGLFSVLARNSGGAAGATILAYHASTGPAIIGLLSLLMVVAALLGRLPWRMTGVAALFVPLLVLQSLFIIPYRYPDDIPALSGMPWLAGLHVLNALFIFWLAFQWPVWARRDVAAGGGPARPPERGAGHRPEDHDFGDSSHNVAAAP